MREWDAALAPLLIVIAMRLLFVIGRVPLTFDYVGKLLVLAALTLIIAALITAFVARFTRQPAASGLAVSIALYALGNSPWFVTAMERCHSKPLSRCCLV